MQHTLKSNVTITDIGLHSGQDITMTIKPAPADHGIIFVRTDITDKNNVISAKWDGVVDTQLCTVIGNDAGVGVGTVEHLMSALRGLGIDNALIEIDGAEIPAMDGSAQPFAEAIEKVGVVAQSEPRRVIRILKEVRVEEGDKWASLSPAEASIFSGEIDFDHETIGTQRYSTELVNGNFLHDIASARTFGFLHEVEYMRTRGLALGGSMDNAIVLNEEGVMNDGGLRYQNEFIRHKLLDAIGDLYLAGGPIVGAYESYKAGHALNNKLLHALFADEDAWEIVDLYVDIKELSTGSGVQLCERAPTGDVPA